MVLILANKWDITCDFVVRELRRRGHRFLRLNTEDLVSERATVVLPELRLCVSKGGSIFDLTREVGVIWNRRPGKPFDDVPRVERPSVATQQFVNDQWYSWLESLQILADVVWINHPQVSTALESKIRQLRLASLTGFSVPKTVVSNDPDAVRHLLEECGGRLIAKALYSPLIEEPDQDFFIFTNEITDVGANEDSAISLSPCIFQEAVVPKIDYRITVIGDTVLPVRIESADGSPVDLDWRTKKEGLKFCPCTLPPEIERLCRSYVQQSGLAFGAIDLAEHNGQFFFLEINPNGEWGWLQMPNGIPIAETLCEFMIGNDFKDG